MPELDDRAMAAAAQAVREWVHQCNPWILSFQGGPAALVRVAYFAALDPITLLNEACAAFENAVGTTYGVSHGMRAALEALGLFTPDTEEPT